MAGHYTGINEDVIRARAAAEELPEIVLFAR